MLEPTQGNSSVASGTSVPLTSDYDQILAWIQLIHGNTFDGESDGYIHINSKNLRSTNWVGRTFTNPADAARYAHSLDGDEGVYMRTTTLATRPDRYERGSDGDSRMLPGFAADMDIAGPGHKTDKPLPTDVGQCRAIIAAANLPEPTLWVHSGGGMYPWWLLEHCKDLTVGDNLAQAQRVSTMLHDLIGRWAEHLGFFYGTGVKDMSRVMRIPGTVNRKEGLARPCRIMQPAAYEFYDWDVLAATIERCYAEAPAPKAPEIPRLPVLRPESAFSELRPGDDFNDRMSWQDILVPHGWRYMYNRGVTSYWQRPGKDDGGHSATTGRAADADRLFVFTDATVFTQNEPYTKFAAHTLLNHGGDFGAATRELRALGFGGERVRQPHADPLAGLLRPKEHDVTDAALPGPVAESGGPGPEDAQLVQQTDAPHVPVVIESDKTLPVLGHDGLPSFPVDVYRVNKWRDTGLIDMYVQAFSSTLRYKAAQEEWMIWQGTRWERDDDARHRYASQKLITGLELYADRVNAQDPDTGKALVSAAAKIGTMAKMNQLPHLAKASPAMTARTSDFDNHPDLVTVDNGTLNLVTGQLSGFDPDLMLTKKVNATFDPDAKGPRTLRFLETVQPDPEVRAYMKRLVGYTVLGRSDERVMPIIHGLSGSGKSAFLEMLYYTLGDFAAVADPTTLLPQPDNYQGPSEKLHSLMGSRFVKMSELPENASLNQALVKNITGSDTQKTRPLYGHPVEWQVQYVVWMAVNNLPRITSTDNAIWKRVKPIHFPNVFVEEDGSVASGAADKDIGRQLARDEGSFILNWILEGIAEYLAVGLSEPPAVATWLGEYRDAVDTTRQFVAEAQELGQLVADDKQMVGARELYKVYLAWSADAGNKFPLNINNFKLRMLANGFKQERKEKGLMWVGLGIGGFIGEAMTRVRGSGMDEWRAKHR